MRIGEQLRAGRREKHQADDKTDNPMTVRVATEKLDPSTHPQPAQGADNGRSGFSEVCTPNARAHEGGDKTVDRNGLDPRQHFFSLADGFDAVGIVGRLGSELAGELWLTVQAWEKAKRQPKRAAEIEAQYWELAGRVPDAQEGGRNDAKAAEYPQAA